MKVAIVGAGICGLYLGWKLAEKRHQVTIFEKRDKIGKVACSGLFSERILKFIPESRKLIQNRIKSAIIHFPRRTVRIHFSKNFLVMSHFELDNLVANLAEKAGVKINLNHLIDSIPQGFDRVIGCDGPNSIIRKKLGLSEPKYRLTIQGFVSSNDNSEFVETWPVKEGFIWKIPRGKPARNAFGIADAGGEIEYGIIASPKEAKNLFDKFIEKNNIRLERLVSGIVPQGFEIASSDSVTLCGDSTGLTKPWSGGGVIWGLISADILLKNFPDFLRYENRLKKKFLPRIIFSKIATKIVYFLGFNSPWVLPKNRKVENDFLIR